MIYNKLIRTILSLPKTVFFNFRVLPLKQAIKLPFYVDYRVALLKLHKNTIKINSNLERFSIRIGWYVLDEIKETGNSFFYVAPNAELVFEGNAELACGISIKVCESAKLCIGNNFYCNKNCTIVCRESIKIGNDALLGWGVSIIDNDGATHEVLSENTIQINKKPIIIGNHVWLCAESSIMKGVILRDDTVVAYNSCVTKSVGESNVVVAGFPATVVKHKINWKR